MKLDQITQLNRREMLLLAGSLAAPGFVSAAERSDTGNQDAWMNDPEKSFINYVRLMGDTSGRVSPQWWRGAYMGIFPDRHPEILFRLESCEMKRCLRRSEYEYEFQYRIFTMFLDPVTGETLHGQRWHNPITGKDVVVEPNISGADNTVKLEGDQIMEFAPASNTKVTADVWWSVQGPYMMAHVDRERSKDRVIPLQDYLTLFGDRADAADFGAPRLEVRFNTTFVAPFQRFMDTSTDLGIALWHASGHKAESVASLPGRYRAELARYRPELSDWIADD